MTNSLFHCNSLIRKQTTIELWFIPNVIHREYGFLDVNQPQVLILTNKAINNLAPSYISHLLVHYNPPRALRSGEKHLFEVPRVWLKTCGERAFSVATPSYGIKSSPSVAVFKSHLTINSSF